MSDPDPTQPSDVTHLLGRIHSGDPAAADALIDLVYRELRQLADAIMRRQRPDQTLQPTALVHEAWIKLAAHMGSVEDRHHFFALAARAMRQVLADHARARASLKRGGNAQRLTLHDAPDRSSQTYDLVAFSDSLERLATLNERHAKVVELRLLGGLTIDETARMIGVSPATVKSDWSLASAWLWKELAN